MVSSRSHLPPGWIQQWDQSSQRYYYLEQTTGRSQWDLPVEQAGGSGPSTSEYGYASTQGQNHGYQGYSHSQGQGQGQGFGFSQKDQRHPLPVTVAHTGGSQYPTESITNGEKKKSGGHAGLLAAGAGSLLVGGIAGAALSRHSSHNGGKCIPSELLTAHSAIDLT